MMEYLTSTADLTSVADALRSRFNLSGSMVYPDAFLSALFAENLSDSEALSYVTSNLPSVISCSGVTKLKRDAFRNCTTLTDVDLPNCLSAEYYAFQGCTNLQNVSLPKVEYLGLDCFSTCTKLTVLSFPHCTRILNYAFYGCNRLSSIYLMGSSFVSIDKLAFTVWTGSIYVPSSMLASYQTMEYWSSYASRLVGA